MSPFQRETLYLSIARSRLAFCEAASADPPTSVEFAGIRDARTEDAPPRLEAALELALRGLGARKLKTRGPVVHAVLSNRLALHWIVKAPSGLASLNELKAVAAARMAAIFDVRSERWVVEAEWTPERPFLCTAIPRWLLNGISERAANRRVAWQLSTALDHVLARLPARLPDGWICMRTALSLCVLKVQSGAPVALRSLPRDHGGGTEHRGQDAVVELRRQLVRNGETATTAYWIDLSDPEQAAAASLPKLVDGIELIAPELKRGSFAALSRMLSIVEAAELSCDEEAVAS